MAANGNHSRAVDKQKTFNLSNASPQYPAVNRGPVKRAEERIRSRIDKRTSAYVATALVYPGRRGAQRTIGPGRVYVPSAIVKVALYLVDRKPHHAEAWIIPNARHTPPDAPLESFAVTVRQAEDEIAADLFSFVPDDVESRIETAEPSKDSPP